MPRLAPVMRATRPCSPSDIAFLPIWDGPTAGGAVWSLQHRLADATVDLQYRAGHVGGEIGSQEHHGVGDFGGLRPPADPDTGCRRHAAAHFLGRLALRLS